MSRRTTAKPDPLLTSEARRLAAGKQQVKGPARPSAASAEAAGKLVRDLDESARSLGRAAKRETLALGAQPEDGGAPEEDDVEADGSSSSGGGNDGDSSMQARLRLMEQQFGVLMARNQQLEAEVEKANGARQRAEAAHRLSAQEAELQEDDDEPVEDAGSSAHTSEEEDEASGAPPTGIVKGRSPSSAPGGPQRQPAAFRTHTTSMAIPPPARPAILQFTKIEETLEQWLKAFKVWFEAVGVDEADDSTRVLQALATVDTTVQSWWETCAEAKEAKSWTKFEAALRKTFIKRDEADRAREKLRALRMTPGEDYHAFFIRVEGLRVRAGVDDSERTTLDTVFAAFDQSRWPMASAQTAADIREGRIKTISALGEALSGRILDEPKYHRPCAAQPASVSASAKARLHSAAVHGSTADDASSEGATTTMEVAMRAMAAQMEAVQRQLSALQSKPSSSSDQGERMCRRCGDKSHWLAECKQPDNRVCFKCKKRGHVKRDCKEDASAKEGAQQPLNREARQ